MEDLSETHYMEDFGKGLSINQVWFMISNFSIIVVQLELIFYICHIQNKTVVKWQQS